ncbi:hypothetical protein F5I97DRAFT_1830295 [Phlebopus sp. FC_14]|nr:hypothetical protein F5I97DRAFT_1830295 [Phlebopus sp. FC_14]
MFAATNAAGIVVLSAWLLSWKLDINEVGFVFGLGLLSGSPIAGALLEVVAPTLIRLLVHHDFRERNGIIRDCDQFHSDLVMMTERSTRGIDRYHLGFERNRVNEQDPTMSMMRDAHIEKSPNAVSNYSIAFSKLQRGLWSKHGEWSTDIVVHDYEIFSSQESSEDMCAFAFSKNVSRRASKYDDLKPWALARTTLGTVAAA